MVTSDKIFSGFASNLPSGQAFDEDLIVIDLLNHFYTRQGERVMDPQYGSIIWDLLFELKSDFQRNEIERDILRIIQQEPRVNLESLQLLEQEHGYVARVTLSFVEFSTTRTLALEFNQRLADRTTN